ncbi:proteoglycan 4-like [Engraulis encrasicolus]|uniref:proteoglycan 4-like n=1 Tax=Engraulis encrasicolus TaxID=184585 RepID=UPI002FD16A75
MDAEDGIPELLRETLDHLSNDDFKRFRHCLDDLKIISWGKLEQADITETVKLMQKHFKSDAGTTMLDILKKIKHSELAERLENGLKRLTVNGQPHIQPHSQPQSQSKSQTEPQSQTINQTQNQSPNQSQPQNQNKNQIQTQSQTQSVVINTAPQVPSGAWSRPSTVINNNNILNAPPQWSYEKPKGTKCGTKRSRAASEEKPSKAKKPKKAANQPMETPVPGCSWQTATANQPKMAAAPKKPKTAAPKTAAAKKPKMVPALNTAITNKPKKAKVKNPAAPKQPKNHTPKKPKKAAAPKKTKKVAAPKKPKKVAAPKKPKKVAAPKKPKKAAAPKKPKKAAAKKPKGPKSTKRK